MKKLTGVMLFALFIVQILIIPCYAQNEKYIIIDDGYVSSQTLSRLEFKAENIANMYGVSVYFIMNSDVGEKGAYKAATEFYEKNTSGKAFVFCMNSNDGSSYICGENLSESDKNLLFSAYSTAQGGTYGDRIGGYIEKAKELAVSYTDFVLPQSERLMPRFMDYADVIENERESAIYTDIDMFSEKNFVDVVMAFYSSSEKPSDYADKFYRESNFGFGEQKDGVILCVNTSSNEICLRAEGNAESVFTSEELSLLSDSLYLNLMSKQYIDMFITYLEGLDKILNEADMGETQSVTQEENADADFPALPDKIGLDGEMPRLYDGANIISDNAENEILLILNEVSTQTKTDFVIMTIPDIPDGFNAKEYAEKYFEHFSFGLGGEKNGVLLLIALEPECCFLTAFGKASRLFSENDLKKYTESFYSLYNKDRIDDATRTFAVEAAPRLMKEKLRLPAVAASLLTAAAVIVIIAIISSKRKGEYAEEEYSLK